MPKYLKLSNLLNVLPEAIAYLATIGTIETKTSLQICLSWLICSIIFRFIWNSAIIVHGLGHTIAIALADRELSAINLTNITEHQNISSILRSLFPFLPIFIPRFDPHPQSTYPNPYLSTGKPSYIRLKAVGGLTLNFLVATIFYDYFDNFFGYAVAVANLLIAFSSLSDLKALITGIADCFYCGNFGFIAERKPDDGPKLLPTRMKTIALQMGHETEVRGAQAGGGFVIGTRGKKSAFIAKKTVFVGKKIVNRKRGNLTKSLEAAFAPVRQRAIATGVKPLESTVTGVWHYRYATSGTAASELETHWHEWMEARNESVWRFTGREWLCETKNVNHRITHNGDFNSWKIFARKIDNATLGLWLERVLHTPNKTTGDSPKIAGMMDLLVTQGMWYSSVRLAYQQAVAISVEEAFDGQKPTAIAPNTAPSSIDLNTWAEIFQNCFIAELSRLKSESRHINLSEIQPKYLKSSVSFQQSFINALGSHELLARWSRLQITLFVRSTLDAFFDNDLYKATQIFISQAQGSFGLVTASTLSETELVLCAKGQPISIGFNREQDYMVYASAPSAVDRILLDRSKSLRLDLDQSGEVAKISAKDITVYSLTQQQEMRGLQLNDRWISMTKHPLLSEIKLTQTKQDPVADDINSIPQVLHEIKTNWENPTSLNRRSANYLISLMVEKAQRFEKRQKLMFKAGFVSRMRTMPAVDLLITGEENSLWLGEKFAQDLKIVFPFLNVVTISANQILLHLDECFSQLNLGKDSLVLAITQSGQTFSTIQAINIFDGLSGKGSIGELFILTGELSSFMNSTQGRGGLTTTSHSGSDRNHHECNRNLDSSAEPKAQSVARTNATHSSLAKQDDGANAPYLGAYALHAGSPRNGLSRIFVNGSGRRTAEPSTVAVAAARQTLTELLLYLAKQMRHRFPNSDPFGMTLTIESLMVLAMIKEDFLNKNVLKIIGTTAEGKSLKSVTRQTLIQSGHYWASHITETPLAWAVHSLYIFISVGWVIPFGHTLPLAKTLSGFVFDLINLPVNTIQLLLPLVTLTDIAVYIFGAWLWTLAIRYFQGRKLFARMGKRTLIIGDVTWVNQLLEAYVSKLFALSYGIATIEVHGDNPQDSLLHSFGHRVVRGTLILLGIPDGRHGKYQQETETAATLTGKQANGIRNFNVGAEIIAMSSNKAIANDFTKALILDSNNDSIYFRSTTPKQKEQIEKLRESCFGSFQRLLASYVFFWALAKKVASFPLLKYKYWKSQSRTKTMTTASPIGAFNLDKWTSRKKLAKPMPRR